MADSAADLEAHPHQQGGAKQTAKDLFSGAAGGVAQVLLGKFDLAMKLGDEAHWARHIAHVHAAAHAPHLNESSSQGARGAGQCPAPNPSRCLQEHDELS